MNGIFVSVLTACLTIFIGVIVFALQKLFEKLYVERLITYNRIWMEIDQILILNTHKITKIVAWDTPEERIKVSNELRRLSSELGALQLTKNYSWIIKRFTFFPKANILKAFEQLIDLAVDIYSDNKIDKETFNKYLNEIDANLKLKK